VTDRIAAERLATDAGLRVVSPHGRIAILDIVDLDDRYLDPGEQPLADAATPTRPDSASVSVVSATSPMKTPTRIPDRIA